MPGWLTQPMLSYSVPGDNLAVGPVAHAVECGTAFDDHVDRIIPCQRGEVLVDVVQEFGVGLGGLPGALVIPGQLAAEQTVVRVRPGHAQKRALEHLAALEPFLVAERQRGDARCLKGVAGGDELIDRHRIGDLDAVVLQDLPVVPERVPTVNVNRNGVLLALPGGLLDESGRHHLGPPLRLVELGDRLAVAGHNVAIDQLTADVGLPGIGWFIALKPGLQHRLCIHTRAPGHGRVDDLDVGVLGEERIEQGLQRRRFTRRGPPGEYFQRAGVLRRRQPPTERSQRKRAEAEGRSPSKDTAPRCAGHHRLGHVIHGWFLLPSIASVVRHRTTLMRAGRKRSLGTSGQPAGALRLADRLAPCSGFVHARSRTVNYVRFRTRPVRRAACRALRQRNTRPTSRFHRPRGPCARGSCRA